jgi:hypothetical protein
MALTDRIARETARYGSRRRLERENAAAEESSLSDELMHPAKPHSATHRPRCERNRDMDGNFDLPSNSNHRID